MENEMMWFVGALIGSMTGILAFLFWYFNQVMKEIWNERGE